MGTFICTICFTLIIETDLMVDDMHANCHRIFMADEQKEDIAKLRRENTVMRQRLGLSQGESVINDKRVRQRN